MKTENIGYSALNIVQEFVYDKCGFELTDLKRHPESVEYAACSFKLNGWKVEHRLAKITPTKVGQFVTIWKRNKNAVTEPFDISDDIDFMAITAKSENNIGQFIFPKSILAEKGVISQNGKNGKRGIRVYPPWDRVTNKQGEKTQSWQVKYFVEIKTDGFTDLELVKKIIDNSIRS